jgi:hypothetical protein
VPFLPVKPWQMTLVLLLMRIAIRSAPSGSGHGRARPGHPA